jgi:hypothetical protein
VKTKELLHTRRKKQKPSLEVYEPKKRKTKHSTCAFILFVANDFNKAVLLLQAAWAVEQRWHW